MSKAKPEFVALCNQAEFDRLITETSMERIVLVDVHQVWCGQTLAIMPFLNQLWVDLEDAPGKIHLASLAVDDDKQALLKRIQQVCDPDIKVAKQGCRPLFRIFKQGQCVATVDGVNSPVIRMYLDLHLPKVKKVEKV